MYYGECNRGCPPFRNMWPNILHTPSYMFHPPSPGSPYSILHVPSSILRSSILCLYSRMRTLILSLLFAFSSFAFASHNLGGFFELEYNGDNGRIIRLYTYTDPSAALVDRCEVEFTIHDHLGNPIDTLPVVPRVNGPNGVDSLFPALTCSAHMGEYVSGTIKKNIYLAGYTFPGPGTYEIRFNGTSRYDNAVNMNNSGNQTMGISIRVKVGPSVGMNHSSIILQDTAWRGCQGIPMTHFLNISDPDGDSLAFNMVVPQQIVFGSMINATAWSHPANFGGFFYLGNQGNINWDAPNTLGLFYYAIRVAEYRNGVLLGEQVMDRGIFIEPGGCLVGRPAPGPETTLEIFPNPASDVVKISGEFPSGTPIALYDCQGRKIASAVSDAGAAEIQLGGFATGMYMLRIRIGDRTVVRKVVVN